MKVAERLGPIAVCVINSGGITVNDLMPGYTLTDRIDELAKIRMRSRCYINGITNGISSEPLPSDRPCPHIEGCDEWQANGLLPRSFRCLLTSISQKGLAESR